jgi:hypothetical protein
MDPTLFPADYLERERKALDAFKREYIGISGQRRQQSRYLRAL